MPKDGAEALEMTQDELDKALADAAALAVKAAIDDAAIAAPVTDEGKTLKALFTPAIGTGAELEKDERKGDVRAAAFMRHVYQGKMDKDRAVAIAEKQGDKFTAKSIMSTDFDSAGVLIPADMVSGIYATVRPRSVLRAAMPRILPMARGSIDVPGMSGGPTAGYRGEGQTRNAQTVTAEKRTLDAKILTVTMAVTRQMIEWGGPEVDAAISTEMTNAIAEWEDFYLLRGDGTAGAPVGLFAQVAAANITSGGTVSTAALARALVKGSLKTLTGANFGKIDGDMTWLMTTDLRQDIAWTTDSGLKVFPEMSITAGDVGAGNLGGVGAFAGNNVTAGELALFDMQEVFIGQSASLRFTTSEDATYTDSTGTLKSAFDRGEVVMKMELEHDILLRRPSAGVIKNSITWSAT